MSRWKSRWSCERFVNTATAKRVARTRPMASACDDTSMATARAPGVALRGQVRLQLGRLGRRARPGEGAEHRGRPAVRREDRPEEVGGGRLAARAGDADDVEVTRRGGPRRPPRPGRGRRARTGLAAAAATSASGRSTSRATAPPRAASSARSWPSTVAPGTQQKSAPGSTAARVVDHGADLDVRRSGPAQGHGARRASSASRASSRMAQPPSSSAVVDVVPGSTGARRGGGRGRGGPHPLRLQCRHDPGRLGRRGGRVRRGCLLDERRRDAEQAQPVLGQVGEHRGGDGAAVDVAVGLVDHDDDRQLGLLRRHEAGEVGDVAVGARFAVAALGQRLAGGARLAGDRVAGDATSGARALGDHVHQHLAHLLRRARGHHPARLPRPRRGGGSPALSTVSMTSLGGT